MKLFLLGVVAMGALGLGLGCSESDLIGPEAHSFVVSGVLKATECNQLTEWPYYHEVCDIPATIVLTDLEGDDRFTTLTNDQSEFSFSVPAGTYALASKSYYWLYQVRDTLVIVHDTSVEVYGVREWRWHDTISITFQYLTEDTLTSDSELALIGRLNTVTGRHLMLENYSHSFYEALQLSQYNIPHDLELNPYVLQSVINGHIRLYSYQFPEKSYASLSSYICAN